MAVIEMSVAEWALVPDNPRQRNTERRARSASMGHLSKYSKSHEFVAAATKDGNILCKLDGHTRSLLWQQGRLELPPSGRVTVLLMAVSGIAEAKELYEEMDSAKSTKKPSDTVYGACRECGFELKSKLLESCKFATQLKVADSGQRFAGNIYALVRRWRQYLIELDSLQLSSNYTVLIALMLVAIRKDGIDMAAPFFTALDKDGGVKDSRGSDGVQALTAHMAIRRAEGRTAGYDNLLDMLYRGWFAYSEWRRGRRLRSGNLKQGVDVLDVITSFQPKKEVSNVSSFQR